LLKKYTPVNGYTALEKGVQGQTPRQEGCLVTQRPVNFTILRSLVRYAVYG